MIKTNKKKNQQGFTLVEVIVVAIIVAALAAVAIPMYTSYVTSSRTNAAANAAGSVASFMGACINQAGSVTGVTAGTATLGTTAITISCAAGGGSTMQLPIGIKITVSSLTATGTVTAEHASGGLPQSYNY